MYRTSEQLACPPSYCLLPAPDFGDATQSWCGWSSAGVPYIDRPLSPSDAGEKWSINVTSLTAAGLTMLQVWANPTCEGSQGFWDAQAEFSDWAFENI